MFSTLRWSIVGLLLLSIVELSWTQLIHFENFENCSDVTWRAVSVSGDEDERSWSCENGYMQMNSTIGVPSFDILISPSIPIGSSDDEYLTFNYVNRFDGTALRVLYSTDFSGDYSQQGYNAATWSELPAVFIDYEDHDALYNYSRHPAIFLGDIAGDNVYLAFEYSTEGPSKRWRLDNIKVSDLYYQDADESTSTCGTFKTELFEVIKSHKMIPYTSDVYDVWDALYTTDMRVDDRGQREIVWDMYSDFPEGNEAYTYKHGRDNHQGEDISREGEFYNREHLLARAWWGGDNDVLQNTDLHHIIPADAYVNTLKSAWPIGEVEDVVEITENGTKLGRYPNGRSDEFVLEPIDRYKGDMARMMLYMAVAYEDIITDWSSTYWGGQALTRDKETVFQDWFLDTMLKWHTQDPVSQKEIDRNNAIFSIQNNRNPFIDHPNWVYRIWGDEQGTNCENVVGTEDIYSAYDVVFPNPASDVISLTIPHSEGKRYAIISSLGEQVMTGDIVGNLIDVKNLKTGNYFVLIFYNDHINRAQFVKL